MEDNKTLLTYYINQAIKTARNLSIRVREENGCSINPKQGAELVLIPVYENHGKTSLYKLTQEISATEIVCVDQRPEFVDGYWKRYDGRNVITITDQQNYCMTRYIVCKELMHNYLHDTKSATNESSELRKLILGIVGGPGLAENPSVIADDAAYYGALEYLIPNDTMPLVRASFSEIAKKEGADKAYEAIAFTLRIPLQLVEYRFANDEMFNIDAMDKGPL